MFTGENIRQDHIRKFYPDAGADFKVNFLKIFLASLKDRGFRAVMLYRIGRFFLNRNYKILSQIVERLIHHFCFCEISIKADIGPGFTIYHPFGLVVGSEVKAGKNFNIRLDSTFGGRDGRTREDGTSKPIIGDNVIVAGGVRILGPINIGNNCVIGANSVVISDVPDNSIAAGVPARLIKHNNRQVPLLMQDGQLSETLKKMIERIEKLEQDMNQFRKQ